MEENQKPKSKALPIIIIALIIIVVGVILAFVTGVFDSKKESKNEEKGNTEVAGNAEKYEGIYKAENDKMYIHKTGTNRFDYVIGDNFFGTAIVGEKSAKDNSSDDEYFEFTLVEDGIEVTYHAGENVEVAADTGIYKKVADYSKDNIYKEAVGDPEYLETGYSGLFKNDNVELYVFQISEKEVMVKSSNNTTDVFIDEKFEEKVNEINGNVNYIVKSFFDENQIAYILNFYDKSIEIIVYDVLDNDEDDKKLENNYKFERNITKEEIINEFYSNY